MSFAEILETLLIGPLKLIFEFVFSWSRNATGHPGLSILILSIIINILTLPLYKLAEKMQQQTRETENILHKGVSHIKNSFHGDEKMLILQTYYRQNNYHPTHTLKGSAALFLEIPFFVAAYQFLSGLTLFDAVSLGPIADLSKPDALLTINNASINFLPILMTIINIISCTIFLKERTLKQKLQLYAMAFLFLILLYNSPTCMTLYWTLNNIFSLIKNAIAAYALSGLRLSVLASVSGFILAGYGQYMQSQSFLEFYRLCPIIGLLLQIPILCHLLKLLKAKLALKEKNNKNPEFTTHPKHFLIQMVFLTLLIGLLIPSVYIADSPQEYVDITLFHHPSWYIVRSFCMAAGTFLIWIMIFYNLLHPKWKTLFEYFGGIFCSIALVNYMFFGTESGIISSTLRYENGLTFSMQQQLINLEVLCILGAIIYYIMTNKRNIIILALSIINIAFVCMSAFNLITIQKSINQLDASDVSVAQNMASFSLSQDGKNVVIILLDRAFNAYVPYIFNEKPELLQQFDGFTYYKNTISYGMATVCGSPAVLGGYEYTPVELNKRDTEKLVDKHNEALKVLPVLFSENDYQVTVCDPPYANYQIIPALSIYNDYPKINTYITQNSFLEDYQKENIISNNHRNFFLFSFMKTLPLCWQPAIYDDSHYNKLPSTKDAEYNGQSQSSLSVAEGINSSFMENYKVLENLSAMTTIDTGNTNNFLFLYNKSTHEPLLLQTPEYVPAQSVDNSQYDSLHSSRFILDEQSINMDNIRQMTHYHVNMASLLLLGDWFDYLRQNNVYDNTKIILVADHGENLYHYDELLFSDNTGNSYDAESYYPLLMVKDFNSTGFTTSAEFMTNADVPTLATQSIIPNPVNPFTGALINNDEKTAHEQFILLSFEGNSTFSSENVFPASAWACVKNNIWNRSNWTFSEEETILTEHILP